MDRDGVLDSIELQHMIEILVFIAKENKPRNEGKDDGQDDFKKCRVNQSANREVSRFSEGNNRYLDESYVKLLEDLKGRLGKDGTLSQEDFLMWSVEDNPLVAPLLELLFEVCHVSLGLKPHCRHHEHEIGEFFFCVTFEIVLYRNLQDVPKRSFCSSDRLKYADLTSLSC